jgi:hypothetical protein
VQAFEGYSSVYEPCLADESNSIDLDVIDKQEQIVKEIYY